MRDRTMDREFHRDGERGGEAGLGVMGVAWGCSAGFEREARPRERESSPVRADLGRLREGHADEPEPDRGEP